MTSSGPHFLGIGAQKAGTTWLFRNLRRHPGIWMPPVKELHYFDLFPQVLDLGHAAYLRRMMRGDTGFDRRWRGMRQQAFQRNRTPPRLATVRWDLRHLFGHPSDEWYRRLFDSPGEGHVTGEITPGYSALDPGDVRWVHDVVGDAKLLLFLRNPVERSWSHAAMDARRDGGSLEQSTDDEVARRLRSQPNVGRTAYATILERWENEFGTSQLFVGFLEDIALWPGRTLARVYEFLGLGDDIPHEVIRDPVFAGSTSTIPRRFAVTIAQRWLPELEQLEPRFGGYVTRWLELATRLAADEALPDEIALPLWQPERNEIRVLSGPLAELEPSPPPPPEPTPPAGS